MMFKPQYFKEHQIAWGRYPIMILTIVFLVSSFSIFSHLRSLNIQLIEATAKQSASQHIEVLTEFRLLYDTEVVQTALQQGLQVSHHQQNHQQNHNDILLPAALSRLLDEKVSTREMTVKTRLYSPWPFPGPQGSGGLSDDFGHQAWDFLKSNKDQPFISTEKIDGTLKVRYAMAELMRQECVDCHNSQSDSPKKDWQVGDISGVLEVEAGHSLTTGLDMVNAIFIQVVVLVSLLLLIGLIIVSLMITTLWRTNQATMKLNNQLSQQVEERKAAEEDAHTAKDEANMANKAKSIFLANISHEIRTPMNAIMGYCQILKRDSSLTEDQYHSLHVVEQSSFHLLGLINDILDISKIESGVQQINPVSFNLISLLQGLSDMFRLKTQEKGLAWQVALDFLQNEYWVIGDEGKLRQILINIIGNAVKFTDQGFVQLSAYEQSESVFYFEVSDSGLGISKEDQAKLFTPFSQGYAGIKKGGTGLGLTISKKYLELMGTTLELESEERAGTTFCFELQLQYDTSHTQKAAISHSYKCLANHQPVRVLVVDDIQINRDILTRILEDARFTVTQAIDGYAALDLMEQAPFDLVLTDIVMPKMDGVKLLSLAKNTEANRSTKMIAITACSLGQDRSHYISLGFANYISKPFLIDDLFACIEQTIKVEFEYRDIDAQAAHSANSISLTRPKDKALLDKLIKAAELYRVSDIESLLSTLESKSGKYSEFITAIRVFLAQYDMDKLLAFLQEKS